MSSTDRRTFLKAAAAAATAAALPLPETEADASTRSGVPGHVPPDAPPLGLINLLQGTESSYLFSRGNTLPIAAVPFGMAHWTFQSADDSPWFFRPGDRRVQGLRSTHQLSPWLGDYGHATFMPVDSTADVEPLARSSSYRPEDATFSPAELHARLLRYCVDLRLAPSTRGAILQIRFDDPGDAPVGLAIDLPGDAALGRLDAVTNTFHGSTAASAGGTPENFRTHYCVRLGDGTQQPALRLEEHVHMRGTTFVLRYRAQAKVPMSVRIGTSFISAEQAQLNLETELGRRSFEEVRGAAEATWNDHLKRALVEGGTANQRRVFYSAMYRALLFPRTWHELDRENRPFHFSAFNGKVEPGVMYADHGYWDVYRAWYPWMSILFPERLSEILQAWVNAAREGGWLPQFPSPGYRACMTGSLIDAVFADAAVKGVQGFDLSAAYTFLRKHATQPGSPEKGYGRRGLESYLKFGYCPEGVVDQSAAETVDSAYGDFCIAQIAGLMGKSEDQAMFGKRSENWRHLFDPETGFLRGKTAEGNWVTPFDPIRWGSPFVEGSAWQHRWDVPHDPEALFRAMGGAKVAAAQLETMLTMPATFHTGAYRQEIHEMSEMAAAHFGQYAHSNQPVHHVLYLFALAGRADRTQYWARRVMEELYTPDDLPGDEDTGSMAAWFLLSSCGFYPVCPGKPEYVLGAPLFDRVTLRLPNGNRLVITAHGNARTNRFVRSVRLNGTEHTKAILSHQALIAGGSLDFTMSAMPQPKPMQRDGGRAKVVFGERLLRAHALDKHEDRDSPRPSARERHPDGAQCDQRTPCRSCIARRRALHDRARHHRTGGDRRGGAPEPRSRSIDGIARAYGFKSTAWVNGRSPDEPPTWNVYWPG